MKTTSYMLTGFLFFVLSLFVSSKSEAQQKIRISYFSVPPFIIYDVKENNLAGGALYEFIEQYIGPEMGVEFIWDSSPSAIPRQITSISNGLTDAIALLSYSPQRAEQMSFTAVPFFMSSPGIALLKNNKLNKIEKIEDILHLKIGYGKNIHLTPFMKDERITFELVASGNFNEQNFLKLMKSRIDAVYTPDLASLLSEIKYLELEEEVKVLKIPDKRSANHVVFSNDMKEIALRFNTAFEKIDGKNTFLDILSRYIDIDKVR